MDESESDRVDTPASDLAASVVDAPHLTKTTWRASKHHRLVKRTHGYAGRTVAPAAFLEAAKRTQFKPGRPGHRVCSATKRDGTPCRMLALRGMKICLAHGGAAALARQGRYQPSGRAAAAIAENQAKAAEMRSKMPEGRPSNVPSSDLTKLRCYIEASERQRIRLAMAYGTDSWFGVVMSMREHSDPSPGAVRNEPPPGGVRKDFGDGGDW
jgi:hypothetical protein